MRHSEKTTAQNTLYEQKDKQNNEDIFSKWKAYFHVLIETIPDTIYFKDKQSRFTLINHAQKKNIGVEKPEDAYGKTDFDFFAPDHARAAFEDEQRIIKDGRPLINKRECICRADGTYRWVLATKVPVSDDDGEIIGIAGISRDITEQVEIENEIRQSEQKFRSVWENSLDGMRLIDSRGIVISVNDAFCRMVDMTEKELIGSYYHSVYSSRERSSMKKKFIERYASKSIEPHFEREIELWNGKRMWFEVSNSYIDTGGQEFLLLSIFRDITERKEMIERLKMFEDSINSVNDSIIITDLDTKVLYVNPAFSELFGYDEADVIGKPVKFLGSGSNDPGFLKSILSATLRGGWKGELVNIHKSGREFPVSLSTSMIRTTNGEPVALIGVSNDISVQKKMEEQLRQAQKIESIGVLVGGISHHFNNILNIIVGYTSLLDQEHVDKKKLRNFLGIISDASERGTDLVQHLMTFVKKSPMRPEPVSLNDAIQKTVDVVKESFPDSITFDVQFAAEKTIIHADPDHLRQGILNILLNARDAMPDGGTLTVRTAFFNGAVLRETFQNADQPFYVCIGITDTGTGMDEKTQSHIFEPFFTTKDFGKGVGLGLSMVYGMVESHNGFIDVQSEPGAGTAMLLYFPVIHKG